VLRRPARHGLDELAELHLNINDFVNDDQEGQRAHQLHAGGRWMKPAYAAEDADFTLRLWHVLKPRVGTEHLLNLYERIERPMVRATALMETAGVKIDEKALRGLSADFTTR